jgi:glycosyltransferase involved in cell wall biosynthesis
MPFKINELSMLRIFILSDTAAPHTRRWARWFARCGHEVHVVSFNPKGLPGYDPAVVHSIWEPRFGNTLIERALKTPIIIARLRGLLKRYPPDIVHAHSAGGYAWTTMVSGFRPYVVTPWGTDLLVDVVSSRLNRWLTGLALRRASLVTTDGFHFVEILRHFGVPEKDILVHTFGTDIHHFCPGPDEGERHILGVGEGPLVISTRTLNPVHDVETFVRALQAIHSACPSARFVIVGEGTDREKLESLAASLGVSFVTRFTGMVEEDRMRRLLRASDVYVSTSKMDAGLAASTAEAMAVGLPVVQTDNSDNTYWTPPGEGGLLVPNGDPVVLAEAVIRLLGDVEERSRMGERNRKMIIKEYNMDTQMSLIENKYKCFTGKHQK